jgi:hypothetical protein
MQLEPENEPASSVCGFGFLDGAVGMFDNDAASMRM